MADINHWYQVLKQYNSATSVELPSWTNIYYEHQPPSYWKILGELLIKELKDCTIFEIGSGNGDILYLLWKLGFKRILGVERDEQLWLSAKKKLSYLCPHNTPQIIFGSWPNIEQQDIDILVRVNCVYPFQENENKHNYMENMSRYHSTKTMYLEFVDASFEQPHSAYPEAVRVSKVDVQQAFLEFEIKRFQTYCYPKNSSTKYIYQLKKC